MPVPLTELQDCQIISKTFERGCHHSLTEESVFAVMTPQISTMRSMSKAISKTVDSHRNTSSGKTNSSALTVEGAAAANVDTSETPTVSTSAVSSDNKSDNVVSKIGKRINQSVAPGIKVDLAKGELSNIGKDALGGIFNSECIPCGFRINFKEDFNFKNMFSGLGDQLTALWEQALQQFLSQLLQLIDMFRNLGKYVDLCAFLKFLNDFICIPDLQKILALLAAYIMNIALELEASFDLILSLIAPLFMPFFSNLIGLLNRYLLMILKPIDCIIDSIQNILSKLDYNVLFQNMQNVSLGFGPKQGAPRVSGTAKLPFIDKTFVVNAASDDIHDPRRRAFELSLSAPFDAQKATEQAAVEKATKELEAIRKAGSSVDGSNAKAVEDHRQKQKVAVDNYRSAVKERDLSEIGEANQKIEEFQKGIQGAFFSLINILRTASAKVEAFINGIFDEFRKIIEEFLGGNGRTVFLLNQKLEVIQLVSFVIAVINALKKGIKCNEEGKEVETFISILPVQQGFKIWADDNGNIHINEEDEDISDAIDVVANGRGVVPIDPTPSDGTGRDRTRQKLESLIEFTGDPLIDSRILRAVDGLTTPARVVFKCPLQTSVAQAEQVNKWIQELNE